MSVQYASMATVNGNAHEQHVEGRRRCKLTLIGGLVVLSLAAVGATFVAVVITSPEMAAPGNMLAKPASLQNGTLNARTSVSHGLHARRITSWEHGVGNSFVLFTWNPVKHATDYRLVIAGLSNGRSRTISLETHGEFPYVALGITDMPFDGGSPFKARVIALSHGKEVGPTAWLSQTAALKNLRNYHY